MKTTITESLKAIFQFLKLATGLILTPSISYIKYSYPLEFLNRLLVRDRLGTDLLITKN